MAQELDGAERFVRVPPAFPVVSGAHRRNAHKLADVTGQPLDPSW